MRLYESNNTNIVRGTQKKANDNNVGEGDRMKCNCSDLVDAQLAKVNTRLGYMFGIAPTGGSGARMVTTVRVATEKLDTLKKRSPAPRAVAATFCPFCGVRIVPELSASLRGEEHTAGIARHYNEATCAALINVPRWHA